MITMRTEVDGNFRPARVPSRVSSEATPEQIRRAAQLAVARQARDAADCAELLDMLGLLDTPAGSES